MDWIGKLYTLNKFDVYFFSMIRDSPVDHRCNKLKQRLRPVDCWFCSQRYAFDVACCSAFSQN